jgi:hypothetical protein
MSRSFPLAGAAAALLLTATAGAHATAMRDEGLARRFLHCANVSEVWVEYFSTKDPVKSKDQARGRDLFIAAAETVTDGAFAVREQPVSIEGVKHLLEQQELQKRDLLGPESSACMDIFQRQVVPILTEREAQLKKAGGASAPAASAPR